MKKIMLLAMLSVLMLAPNTLSAQKTSIKKSVPGTWMGKLSAGGMDLRVVFNLKLTPKDSLICTLDSPDQNAKDIPCGAVTLDKQNLDIKAPEIGGEFSGTVMGDSTITGTWTQNGGTFPLNLKKQNIKIN